MILICHLQYRQHGSRIFHATPQSILSLGPVSKVTAYPRGKGRPASQHRRVLDDNKSIGLKRELFPST